MASVGNLQWVSSKVIKAKWVKSARWIMDNDCQQAHFNFQSLISRSETQQEVCVCHSHYLECCAGTVPFKSESILGLYKQICEAPLEFPDDIITSSALKHLLSRMLDKKPEHRMNLKAVMQHPWATYNGMLPLLEPVSHFCQNLVPGQCLLCNSC